MRRSRGAVLAAVCAIAGTAWADTPYPLAADVARANRARVEAKAEGAAWKGCPFAAAVDPLSYIRRTPDLFPEDGDFAGPMKIAAAKGEYENGSFVLFGFEDLAGVTATAGALRNAKGDVIPASEIDLTVVKVWYQQGTAWWGYQGDDTRRVETPELMLHDENLVEVNWQEQENYVSCDFPEGKGLFWVSCRPQDCGWSRVTDIKYEWIHDAKTLQPFALQRDAFKQIMVTLHVPETARPGLYRGAVTVTAGTHRADVPMLVRVWPFKLPRAGLFRDAGRPFRLTFSTRFTDACAPFGGATNEVLRSLVAHNVDLEDTGPWVPAEKLRAAADAYGHPADALVGCLPHCGILLSWPPQESDRDYALFLDSYITLTNRLDELHRAFGPETSFYANGRDEAGPKTVRAERAAMMTWHDAGAKVCLTSRYHPYLLFNADMLHLPSQPRPSCYGPRAEQIHAANEDTQLCWYADPHTGPENPHYMRRVHGLQTWRANYDEAHNYIFFRNNWNDFWIPDEAELRGLMLVYPAHNAILGTLAYEGVREGMDDVRYGTLLKRLVAEARPSKNIDAVYAARAASTWLAQTDMERGDLDYLRRETVRRILDLMKKLGKEEL